MFYRPLGFASLFLDYRLWHTWAPGYHLTNLLMHLLCVIGVFFLCREMRLKDEVCSIATLFFGILPVNAQAVTWIACRFDLLATIFMLWSLMFAMRFRRTGRTGTYVLAIAFFLLAALTKESAYVVPILWIALELLPLEVQQQTSRHFKKRLLPLLGYMGIAGLAFLHRWYVLGNVGGSHAANGAPNVEHFGVQSLIGVFFRAPSAMLLGNNMFMFARSSPGYLTALVVLTASLFLALALLARAEMSSRRTIWFTLIWVLAAIIPVHFYFLAYFNGPLISRVLYFGSAGLAILLAVLLNCAFGRQKLRRVWVLALGILLVAGLDQNLRAWQWASDTTTNFLAELKRLEPSPRQGAAFYIANVPDNNTGVPFFSCCLQDAVRFNYGERTDITAAELTPSTPSSLASEPNVVMVAWYDESTHRYVPVDNGATLKAVKLNWPSR